MVRADNCVPFIFQPLKRHLIVGAVRQEAGKKEEEGEKETMKEEEEEEKKEK